MKSRFQKRLEMVVNVAITALLFYTIFIQNERISNLEMRLQGMQSYMADITSAGCDTEDSEPDELPPPDERW